MPADTVEIPQETSKLPTGEDKINARTLYIQGKGSIRSIALRLKLSPATVRDWSWREDWTELREEYEKRQLARTLGPIPVNQENSLTIPATTPQQNIDQAQRIGQRIKAVEEQMEGLTNPDSLAKLATAHAKLFDAWCTLTGTPRPGVRKAPRGFRIEPQSVSVLVRRLLESDDENSPSVAGSICTTLGIELI